MSDCKLCGRPAGLFRKKHPDCVTKNRVGRDVVLAAAAEALSQESRLPEIKARLPRLAEENYINPDELRGLLVDAWERAVEKSLEDGLLSDEEESCLAAFQQQLELPQAEVDRKGALMRVAKAAVLRDLVNGKVPDKVKSLNLPFMLQKSEGLVWVFPGTDLLVEKVQRHYEGRSAGVSIRICKGVYYRASAFKGHPVDTTYTAHEDTGVVAFTTKHIYFQGARKSFRVRLDKIVSLTPFSDGVGIQRDAASARPEVFRTGDGWFTYNVLSNLGKV